MSDSQDPSFQTNESDSDPAPLVNALFYWDPAAYVLDAIMAGASRKELLQGLMTLALTHHGFPPGGDFEGFAGAVVSGMVRPGYPGLLFRPYDEQPTGIFSRIKASIDRKMGMLDVVGRYDSNGYYRWK